MLQKEIENLTSFSDVCQSKNGVCIIESITQYYQNDADTMSKTAWDEYHFYVEADYLDHFLTCAK